MSISFGRNRILARVYRSTALLMIPFTLSSCTVINLSVGTIQDVMASKEIVSAERETLLGLEPGTRVRWTLADSSRGEGVLVGTHTDDRDHYMERYATWRVALEDSAAVPELGEIVLLNARSVSVEQAHFDGVVREALCLKLADENSLLMPLASTRTLHRPRRRSFDPYAARQSWATAPRRSSGTLLLRTRTDTQRVDVTQIAYVAFMEPQHNARSGIGLGVAMDVVITSALLGLLAGLRRAL
jgi:hypothetical protein